MSYTSDVKTAVGCCFPSVMLCEMKFLFIPVYIYFINVENRGARLVL